MPIKKVLLCNKLNNTIYDIFPKTSADIVTYGESTVAEALASFATDLKNIYTKSEMDVAVKKSADDLYNKIMGITDAEEGNTINEAYDTLKEVADWISSHGDIAAAFTTDIAALKTAVGTAPTEDTEGSGLLKDIADVKTKITANKTSITSLEEAVEALQTAVGNASAGLVKTVADHTTDIAAIKTTIGEAPNEAESKAGSGILKKLADLEARGTTKVEASDNNGCIKVNDTDIKVYELPTSISASNIEETTDRKFVTQDQLDVINNAGAIRIITDQTAIDNEKDLYLIEITD